MSKADALVVTDKDGVRGVIDVTASPPYDGSRREVLVRLEGGHQIKVPASNLIEHKEGGFYLPMSFTDIEGRAVAKDGAVEETVVVPVIQEDLQVRKGEIEIGRVRLTKTVNEREDMVDEPLMQDEVVVQRIPINRVVDGRMPDVRYEGDTMIIPLFEEVMVMQKRVVLKEELRITKRRFETRNPQSVTLRSEEVNVERLRSQEVTPQTPEGGNAELG